MLKFFKKKKGDEPNKDVQNKLEQDKLDKGELAQEELASKTESEKDYAASEANVIEDARSNTEAQAESTQTPETVEQTSPEPVQVSKPIQASEQTPPIADAPKKLGMFGRLKAGLAKTGAGIGNVFLGKKALDDELMEDLETALLMADAGVEVTTEVIDELTDGIARKDLSNTEMVIDRLESLLVDQLKHVEKPLDFGTHKPYVLLMVGINGAGKTTTIGKITQKLTDEGKHVVLAAGDTFRAAAVEQLQTWGERANVNVISQKEGADSASVIYDAYQSAVAKNADVLIADTAGRLHTQGHLMAEIEKVVRVIKKANPDAPHEIMLVIDAGNGQNALNQAVEFNKSLGLTGITVTKLDGTAKGGIVFAVAKKLGVPIRFIGVGEQAEDLRVFEAEPFVKAITSNLGDEEA